MKCPKLTLAVLVFMFTALCLLGGPADLASAQIKSQELPNREGLVIENYFTLHSAIKTDIVFDSNIFLNDRPESEKYDTILKLSPSVGIEIPMGENIFSAEYEPTFAFFSHHFEQDYVDHRIRGLYEAYFGPHKLAIDNEFNRFTNRAGADELGVTGTRTREETNDLEVTLGAEFDQFEYLARYTNYMDRYLNKNLPLFEAMEYDDKNHVYNEAGLEVGYKLFPKTTVLFEGIVGHLYYPSDFVPSSWYFETMGGFKGEWYDKFVFNIRGGLKHQNYGDSDLVRNDDYTGFIARGGVDYNMTDKDVFRLNFSRETHDSIYEDINYYTTNFVSFDYSRRFMPNLSGNMASSWQSFYYPKNTTIGGVAKKRVDNIYMLSPSIRYDINKWVSLQAAYEYRHRNSNFSTFDYDDHRTTLRVTAGF